MITSWFTLDKCAAHYHLQYPSAVLDRCVTFRKNELWLIFRKHPPLLVHLGAPFQYTLISEAPPPLKVESVRVFPELEGSIVASVDMLPHERIMRFHMTNGARLHIVFLSNRGNVISELRGQLQYFKKHVRTGPEWLEEKPGAAIASLAEDVRFSPYWKQHAAEVFGTGDHAAILGMIAGSNGEEIGKRFILSPGKEPYEPSLFYAHYRAYIVRYLQEAHFHEALALTESRLSGRLNDLQKKISQTAVDGNFITRTAEYRFLAETLAACRYLLQDRAEDFEIPPLYRKDGFPERIKLKPELSVSENIDRYYRKAQASERHVRGNAVRHAEFLRAYAEWEERYREFREIRDIRSFREWSKAHPDIQELARTPGAGDRERRPYREYITSDGWRIRVGRSARDNDELTFKHAVKTDLWLHTRHSTGSHVIIKRDGKKDVPKHVIEEAAALAARYSEEKHASLVTVVCTERKYVTKGKGMPPGKVHFQYEKDVTVKPAEV
ncbi:MAG: DUF814 domain-containing protein [Candidatus Marinimicrobia bacterium]|nr:DUF814 domain-containing protein [Candidatus Neomarinimicrobiota bacterium]